MMGGAKDRPPYLPNLRRLAEGGDLRYVDTKNAPEVWRAVEAKFPEQAALR